jgi:type I restriction enzyme S subunit
MVEVDGKVGPEGWEVKSIGDVIQTIGGGTPSRKNSEYWENGTVTWFTPSDLTASKSLFITNSQSQITEIGLKKSSAKLFPPYSVMMTSRATIGVVSINSETACTNQGFIVCIPNERLSAYQIYFWIKSNLETIQSVASGATYKEINKSVFRAMNILVAPKMINKLFFETIHSFFKQIECLQAKNLILIQTRDLLLPRLIEGEIEV